MKKYFAWLFIFVFLIFPFTVSAQNEIAVIRGGNTDSMKIALTFDDGPHPKKTDAILNLLKEYGIHATFFVIGQNVSYYPDVLKREVEGGHEIGNHTYHHVLLSKISEKEAEAELQKTEDIIQTA